MLYHILLIAIFLITSVSANSVSDSENNENGLVEKGVNCVIVEEDELSEELCVSKNANIPRENCIIVEPDLPVEIFEEAEAYEEESKDPFFKIKFVMKPPWSGSKNIGNHSHEVQYKKKHLRFQSEGRSQYTYDVKLSENQRRRINKQLQKLLFQTDQRTASKNLKPDGASTSRVPNVGGMGFSKPISTHSFKEVQSTQSWKIKD
ncbi:hypothetical protein L1987_01874 [Smallanthus sonchifolius]|uniref:Uncharacterized protein n=1 Tax=Smallanthus sonchifolius TaxID=185202 RepID=A0ACB9K666_9ASTR|nr:hypothetical protein L1987_01874 [Smallanthus sonchifolius]